MAVYYGCGVAIQLRRATYERLRGIGILHQSVWYFHYLRKIIPIIWLDIGWPTYLGPTNSDLLFGNLGADTFDFSAPPLPQSGQTTATADRIGDFSTAQGDKIKIDVTGTMEFIALGNASVNSVETAITAAVSANAFAAHDVVFVTGPGTSGFLLVDQNDAGGFGSSTDFAIVLQNFTTLTASDIIAI